MKNCISLISCGNYMESAIEFIGDSGIKNIEVAPLNLIDSWDNPNYIKLKKISNLIRSYEMEVVSIQSIFFKKDLNIFKSKYEAKEHIIFVSKIAKMINCNYIVFGGPKARVVDDNPESYYDDFSDILNSFDGVEVGVEANPEIYSTNFLTDYIKVMRFCEKYRQKPHFDFGCALASNISLADSVKACSGIPTNIHISSPYLVPPNDFLLSVYKKYFKYFKKDSIFSLEAIFESELHFRNYIGKYIKIIDK